MAAAFMLMFILDGATGGGPPVPGDGDGMLANDLQLSIRIGL